MVIQGLLQSYSSTVSRDWKSIALNNQIGGEQEHGEGIPHLNHLSPEVKNIVLTRIPLARASHMVPSRGKEM